MNRRRVILGSVGLLGVFGIGAWGLGHVGLEWKIAEVLHRRLPFLKLDPDGVRVFAKDQTDAAFNKKVPTWSRLRYHFLAAALPSFKRFYRAPDRRSRSAHLEDNLVATYLLSSDFFLHGADQSQTIKYIGYYDPTRPCQNPFARPALDAPATT